MPEIMRKLLRKRSEHNEGMISTLEELTLHQEELESINEVLGATCRKLKILYLQNNLIRRMENLQHLKDLVYLNLALNNISKIEGLWNCEFLNKLDLTVNFIDVDELEASIDHLQSRDALRDLYMMGNPSQATWPGFTNYVIAKLPQLRALDGTEITKSMQLSARKQLPQLEAELRNLAVAKRAEKAEKIRIAAETGTDNPTSIATKKSKKRKDKLEPRVQELDENNNVICEDVDDDSSSEDGDDDTGDVNEDDGLTENTPEVREQIYRELAKQKKDKEDRENANKPRERDYEADQAAALEEVRRKEQETEEREIKQKNEGGWEFRWDEESRPGCIVLHVAVPRHLDSSLIDVDVHPAYVSMVIKSKVLRLRNTAEVKAGESKCQRSKTTGHLLIIMPKVNPRETTFLHAATPLTANKAQTQRQAAAANKPEAKPKKLSLQEQMIQMALAEQQVQTEGSDLSIETSNPVKPSAAVDITSIVKRPKDKSNGEADATETVFDAATKKSSLIMEID